MKGSHKWADVEERSGQSDVQLLKNETWWKFYIVGFSLRFANRFKILYLLQLFRYNYYDTCECAVFSYSIHDLLICYIYRNTDWGSSEDYSRMQPTLIHVNSIMTHNSSPWAFELHSEWTGQSQAVTRKCQRTAVTHSLTALEMHFGLHWHEISTARSVHLFMDGQCAKSCELIRQVGH